MDRSLLEFITSHLLRVFVVPLNKRETEPNLTIQSQLGGYNGHIIFRKGKVYFDISKEVKVSPFFASPFCTLSTPFFRI